jgi:hypothetical protein
MPVGDSSAVAKPGSPMVWSSTRLGVDRRFFSTWSALGNPVFPKLWIAAVISGTCVAAHDTAAIWMMNTLTPSPFLISLLSTVASLPFFATESADDEGGKRSAAKCLEPSLGIYTARRTDLPIREQRIAHAKAM